MHLAQNSYIPSGESNGDDELKDHISSENFSAINLYAIESWVVADLTLRSLQVARYDFFHHERIFRHIVLTTDVKPH